MFILGISHAAEVYVVCKFPAEHCLHTLHTFPLDITHAFTFWFITLRSADFLVRRYFFLSVRGSSNEIDYTLKH